jgi:gluconate 2-dehydrogenase gamma chain
MSVRKASGGACEATWVAVWRAQVMDRRAFLLRVAGGSLAALFPIGSGAGDPAGESLPDAALWQLVGSVQAHLFPSEPEAPGATEINALRYLQWVAGDEGLETDHRAFLLRGAGWVDEQARRDEGLSFTELDPAARERVLRAVAESDAGENWLSVILLYIFEALLCDPVYGGNPNGIAWRWLGHTPGFPRPPADKRYGKL